MDAAAVEACDVIILFRTISDKVGGVVAIAKERGKSVVFLLDDDLLSFHEISREFLHLSPGQASRKLLEDAIRGSDLVIVYSETIRESVSLLNKRVVVLSTNIMSHHLDAAKGKVSGQALPADGVVKVGFAGSGARAVEFSTLWPAIVKASRILKQKVVFEFWGHTPEKIDELDSPWKVVPFSYSYGEYLHRLKDAKFDVMLSPLFGDSRAKLAKSPIKYLEITAAGAVGLYSRSAPYDVIVDGQTGFKCGDSIDDWADAILRAVQLPQSTRSVMLERAIANVERNFTSERVAPALSAALQASLVHGVLRRPSNEDGARPKIAYFIHSPYLGGAEMFLLRLAMLTSEFAFDPIIVLPESCRDLNEDLQQRACETGIRIAYLPFRIETEVDAGRPLEEPIIDKLRGWLRRENIALVHTVTLMREVGEAARRGSVPHISSLFATNSIAPMAGKHCDIVHSDSFLYANRWSVVLGCPARRILTWVPDVFFEMAGVKRNRSEGILRVGIFGSLQSRKGQLQSIEAIGLLKECDQIAVHLHIFGYDHFFPDYKVECEKMIARYGLNDQVWFHGFIRDPSIPLKELDVVLCASDWESMPQAVLEAMASRTLVVTPLVGGIGEIISNGNGIVISDNSAASIRAGLVRAAALSDQEMETKVALSHRVAELETRKHKVALALFEIYYQAGKSTAGSADGATASQDMPNSNSDQFSEQRLMSALDRIRRMNTEGVA